ncbi:hypothetical protein DPSP01_001286 [Paraphaeosphaeria sporulosa]
MASNAQRMSTLTQKLSSEEGWQDLISWDGELYDPLFQGDLGITTSSAGNPYGGDSFSSNTHAPESVSSEQFYETSTTASVFDGPTSFDFAVSRPPSVNEGGSWLSGSPSYTTSATSPLAAQVGMLYQGSIEACDSMLSPGYVQAQTGSHNSRRSLLHFMELGFGFIPPFYANCTDISDSRLGYSSSPFLDAHSYGSSSSYQTAPTSGLFNPHVAGTSHSFSGLDVYASQALDNVGTWVEPSVEPIIEVHQEDGTGAIPIPIPQPGPQRFSNTFSSHPWTDHSSYHQAQHGQPRSITIPQPQIRVSSSPSDYRARAAMERHPSLRQQSPHWSRRVPPVLSASPEQQRSPRPALLTRSLSNPRRSRNKLASPSPTTDNLGWVSYQPNTQHRLVPSGAEGSRRRQRGRIGALTAQQRSHAALMRLVGSCSNCKKRKEKCDPGTPCKSCIDHYKGDLVNHPCRDRLVSGLASVFLAERHGWHPTARPIEASFGAYRVLPGSYSIPITFGFGSVLHVPVALIHFDNHTGPLLHAHTVYAWPPTAAPPQTRTHAVLPAVLTPEAMQSLEELLDTHLALLVREHFRAFPPFTSPLRVLRHVYTYYRALPPASPAAHLLAQSLKLLILVHVGGDITLPAASSSPALSALVSSIPDLPEGVLPTPCFIRAQLGAILPSLALKLMREVLLSLEQLLLGRAEKEWPLAVATLVTLCMTVESVQYHAAKLPYHNAHDPATPPESVRQHDFQGDEDAVRQLREFYGRCFAGCHARLSPEWRGDVEAGLRPDAKKMELPPEDKFIENMREAVRGAGPAYLAAKAGAERHGDDMGWFFDRVVAGLLMLKVSEV